ncbi:MAG: cysteine--tRNA ligase [Dehalococcoidia bacterium]|nr:cysteine--tRNA ligase [Dehalococcoidia bacterium]
MRLYNTLSRQIDPVRPLQEGVVSMYSCGPTVYRSPHIGNFRSYIMADWIKRILISEGFDVVHAKNITDVGHMRQDRLEEEEDKVIAAALSAGKTPEQIASFYTNIFLKDEELLGIMPASYLPKATEHIKEMIELIDILTGIDYAYEVDGNVYFSVSMSETYGNLSGNRENSLREAVRVEEDPLKRDPRDFALWKASEPGRTLEWPSPWGMGFPGWHIECSAMATKYLGQQIDIHTGGVDNIFPHHEGEIAQSEGAFRKKFVSSWVHGQHLMVDRVKMSKSMSNEYTVDDLIQIGFDPMAFRYQCLMVHYRKRLNFSLASLRSSQIALERLRMRVKDWSLNKSVKLTRSRMEDLRNSFRDIVSNDLDMPNGMRFVWDMAKSDIPDGSKLELLLEFDEILGLGLGEYSNYTQDVSRFDEVLEQRQSFRDAGEFDQADAIREDIRKSGFFLQDYEHHTGFRRVGHVDSLGKVDRRISNGNEVESLLHAPSETEFSICIVTHNYLDDLKRCINSIIPLRGSHSFEIMVLDNFSSDGTYEWLDGVKETMGLRIVHTDHVFGTASAMNILIKQSLGKYVILLDTSVESEGDFLSIIGSSLDDTSIGVVGPWGLRTEDLNHFHEINEGGADAMQAYCFAFRRDLIEDVGLMRDSFRFYRNLDLEFSFQFLNSNYGIKTLPNMPMVRHEHRIWTNLTEDIRDRLSNDNFRRFHKKWGHRADLVGKYIS